MDQRCSLIPRVSHRFSTFAPIRGTVADVANPVVVTGPIGVAVATNVQQLRKLRGLGLAELSSRLRTLEHGMSVSTLSKIELRQRRVDVDDLYLLAASLDVAPSALLGRRTDSDHAHQLSNFDALASKQPALWRALNELSRELEAAGRGPVGVEEALGQIWLVRSYAPKELPQ